MKYRHGFHAGNFADVHKHVTLLALIAALQRKEKGFLYLETHAGRGRYELDGADSNQGAEARLGIGALQAAPCNDPHIAAYLEIVARFRLESGAQSAYPGSPVLAAFSSELWMLVLFRCTTFIGVCVELVAAVTWLAELFADKRTRELVIGWTLAAASLGGIFVTELPDLDEAIRLAALVP